MEHNWKFFDWGNNAFDYTQCSLCKLVAAKSKHSIQKKPYYMEYVLYNLGGALEYTENINCKKRILQSVLE